VGKHTVSDSPREWSLSGVLTPVCGVKVRRPLPGTTHTSTQAVLVAILPVMIVTLFITLVGSSNAGSTVTAPHRPSPFSRLTGGDSA
jgi:hypothetical protein